MSRRRVRPLVGTLGDKVCVSNFLQKTNIKVYALQFNELVLQTRRLGYGLRILNTLSQVTGYPNYRVSTYLPNVSEYTR